MYSIFIDKTWFIGLADTYYKAVENLLKVIYPLKTKEQKIGAGNALVANGFSKAYDFPSGGSIIKGKLLENNVLQYDPSTNTLTGLADGVVLLFQLDTKKALVFHTENGLRLNRVVTKLQELEDYLLPAITKPVHQPVIAEKVKPSIVAPVKAIEIKKPIKQKVAIVEASAVAAEIPTVVENTIEVMSIASVPTSESGTNEEMPDREDLFALSVKTS